MLYIILAILSMGFFIFMSVYFLVGEGRQRRKEKILQKLVEHQEDGKGFLRGKDVGGTGGLWRGLVGKVLHLAVIESILVSLNLNISLEKFLVLSLGSGVGFFIPVFAFSGSVLLSLLFFCAGVSIPTLFSLHLKKKREEILVKQLPDAIDMIVRSLRVGQSVDGALRDVGNGMPDPIGFEITKVYNEIAIGLPFESALRNFEKRCRNSADIKIFCGAFVIQRESGGNLTEILNGLSRTIRERFALKMQVKAASSESRTSALVLAIIPVAFALVTWLLNPNYISRLANDHLGREILFFAVFLDVFAFIIMRRITKIDA